MQEGGRGLTCSREADQRMMKDEVGGESGKRRPEIIK